MSDKQPQKTRGQKMAEDVIRQKFNLEQLKNRPKAESMKSSRRSQNKLQVVPMKQMDDEQSSIGLPAETPALPKTKKGLGGKGIETGSRSNEDSDKSSGYDDDDSQTNARDSASKVSPDLNASPQIINQVIDLKNLSRAENEEVSKVMTHTLIEQVTRSINEVNFMGQEANLKEVIMTMLKEPLTKMSLQEHLLSKFGETLRRNVRRTHDLEHILEKYQRAQTFADSFEEKFQEMDKKLKVQATTYDEEILKIKRAVNEDVPDKLNQQTRELESWKRWFVRIQREFEGLQTTQKQDHQLLMTTMRTHMNSTLKNLDELLKNQVTLDQDGSLLKTQVKDINDQMQEFDTRLSVSKRSIARHKEEIDSDMTKLHERIQKAEDDRMDKYYKQVGILQDWVVGNKDMIADNRKIAEAITLYFNQENVIQTYNQISETLVRVLEGSSYNKFIEYMKEKQDQIGRKKLNMSSNTFQERLIIASRYLSQKQPFYPLPQKIPDKELPPTFDKIQKLMSLQEQRIVIRLGGNTRESNISQQTFSGAGAIPSSELSQAKQQSDSRSKTRKNGRSSKRSFAKASPEQLAIYEESMKKDKKQKKEKKRKRSNRSRASSTKRPSDSIRKDSSTVENQNTNEEEGGSPPQILNLNKIGSPDAPRFLGDVQPKAVRKSASSEASSYRSRLSSARGSARKSSPPQLKKIGKDSKRKNPGLQTNDDQQKQLSVLKKSSVSMVDDDGQTNELSDIKKTTKQIRIVEPQKDSSDANSQEIMDTVRSKQSQEPGGPKMLEPPSLKKGNKSMPPMPTSPSPNVKPLDSDYNATIDDDQLDKTEHKRNIVTTRSDKEDKANVNSLELFKDNSKKSVSVLKLAQPSANSGESHSPSCNCTKCLHRQNVYTKKNKKGELEQRSTIDQVLAHQDSMDQKSCQDSSHTSSSQNDGSLTDDERNRQTKPRKSQTLTMSKAKSAGQNQNFKRMQSLGTNALGKKIKHTTSSNEGDSSSGSGSGSSSSSSDSLDGRTVKKGGRQWVLDIIEDMREEYRDEDELYFASKTELEEQKAHFDGFLEQFQDHTDYSRDVQKQTNGRIDNLVEELKYHQEQIKANDEKRVDEDQDLAQKMDALEKRFKGIVQDQFDDFCLKIEGELTRRNRLRIEAFARFKEHETQLKAMQSEIERFEGNQSKIVGSIKKLMYTNDIQVALNIQDELDRDWISLFAGIDERTGLKQYDYKQSLQQVQQPTAVTEMSKYTLNPDCISCTGNMQTRLNIFKVACLNYEANPVAYQGVQIKRRELLSMQRVIQDMAKNLVETIKEIQTKPQRHHITADFSPERTGMQSPADQAGGQPSMRAMTQEAMDRAKSLLGQLVFKDKDLNDAAHIQKKQQDVLEAIFGQTKDSIALRRGMSAYKRKSMRGGGAGLGARPKSMLSTLLGSAASIGPGNYDNQFNIGPGSTDLLPLQSVNTEVESRLEKQSTQSIGFDRNFGSMGIGENNNYAAQSAAVVMGQERKVHIPMPVFEVGSEMLASNDSHYASLPQTRLNPGFALKNRLLQPIVTRVIAQQVQTNHATQKSFAKQRQPSFSKSSSRQSSRPRISQQKARAADYKNNEMMSSLNLTNKGAQSITIPTRTTGKQQTITNEENTKLITGESDHIFFDKIPHDKNTNHGSDEKPILRSEEETYGGPSADLDLVKEHKLQY